MEVADGEIGPRLAQHPGHQLQLVVLHPYGRVLGRDGHGGVGEALVHLDVRIPPLPLVARRGDDVVIQGPDGVVRSEEHTSKLQSLMRISYAVFCLKKKTSTT